MSDIGTNLEGTPPEVLRAFLARELAADPDLERRFHSVVTLVFGVADVGAWVRAGPQRADFWPGASSKRV